MRLERPKLTLFHSMRRCRKPFHTSNRQIPPTICFLQYYLESNSSLGFKFGSKFGKLLVRHLVTSKEGILAVTELLGKWLEPRIDKDNLVGSQFEELGVGTLVRKNGEVGVVNDEPLVGPRGSTGIVLGLFSIRTHLLASIGELGLFGSKTRSVLVRTAWILKPKNSSIA